MIKKTLLLLVLPLSAHAALIGFNAEDGSSESGNVVATLGADFDPALSDSGTLGGQYITSETDGGGDGPGTAARVASYDVTFAEAGSYDLYAKVWIGSAPGADDSFFYGNSFGTQASLAASANWIHINGLYDVQEPAGNIEKYVWINFSQAKGTDWAWGESGVSFTVTSAGVRTIQVGAREDGLRFDAFAFGSSGETFTAEQLDAAVDPQPAILHSRQPEPDSVITTELSPVNLGGVLVDGDSTVDPASIELILDGTMHLPLEPGDVVKVAATTTVAHAVSSLTPGTHTVSLVYDGTSPATGLLTNTWSFSVQLPVEVQVYIIGDSTVLNRGDIVGWGQVIDHYFDRKVSFHDYANPGESSKTFITENRWADVLSKLSSNDYVLIQFGHNDSHNPIYSEATDANGDYKTYLQQYIDESRAIGAIPVLVTPMYRRSFESNGNLLSYIVDGTGYTNDLAPYAAAMKQVAEANSVPCVDLFTRSGAYMEPLGNTACYDFLMYHGDGGTTHFSEFGATTMASMVAQGLSEVMPSAELTQHLRWRVLEMHDEDIRNIDLLRPILAIEPEASVYRVDWFLQDPGTYLLHQAGSLTNSWSSLPDAGTGTAGSLVIAPDHDAEFFRVANP